MQNQMNSNTHATHPQGGFAQSGQQGIPSTTQQVKNAMTPGQDRMGNPTGNSMGNPTGNSMAHNQTGQSTTQQVKNAMTPGQTGNTHTHQNYPMGQQPPMTTNQGVQQLNHQHDKSTAQKIKEKLPGNHDTSSSSSDDNAQDHKGIKEKLMDTKEAVKDKMGMNKNKHSNATTAHGTHH